LHGGRSAGPKTSESKARQTEAIWAYLLAH